jgi:hypothetical protein
MHPNAAKGYRDFPAIRQSWVEVLGVIVVGLGDFRQTTEYTDNTEKKTTGKRHLTKRGV